MPNTRDDKLQWIPSGEVDCPSCGARYRVETAKLPERRDGYAKCEACGALMDEWICDNARRYERLRAGRPAAAQPAAASAHP